MKGDLLDGVRTVATMRIKSWWRFFFSLPTYSLSLVFASMGVKKGSRMLWSNGLLAVLLMLALLKFGLHAFSCSSRSDGVDFRSRTGNTWDLESVYPRRRMTEGVAAVAGLGDEASSRTFSDLDRGQEELRGHPTMTVFCAPKAFDMEDPNDPQRRALLSWLRLKPRPKVVLMGNEPTLEQVAKEFPEGWISVEASLDYNMRGMPMFHSMMARARAADTNVSMMINGDIVLLEDFMVALRKTFITFDDWLLTAMRWDVKELPYRFQHKGSGVVELIKSSTGEIVTDSEVASYGRAQGTLHSYGGVDFWAWNVRRFENGEDLPLHATPMPPFSFGRGRYDNWLTHQIVEEAGKRAVIDASDSIVNIHVAHSYAHVGTGANSAPVNFWSSNKKNSWEAFANIHLSQTVGNFKNQMGTALHIPYKMISCSEPTYGNLCLTKRVKAASCTCEYSSHVNNTQTEPMLEDNGRYRCGSLSVEQPFRINAVPNNKTVPGLPHTLEHLLQEVADESKTVVLVAVTSLYKEMMLNYMCRASKLGMHNVVIAALDVGMYTYAFTQGLPVYYENTPGVGRVKARCVMRVLQLGYNVLWTDVDVVLLQNPLSELLALGHGTFPILSNEPDEKLPANGLRRVDAGFYLARAEQRTKQVLSAVVAYAEATGQSDQLSLYAVLCGVKGEKRNGNAECRHENGLRSVFLERSRYPNGAVYGLWESANTTAACSAAKAMVLHNNWVAGKQAKVDRLVRNDMWMFDSQSRMCVHDWHPWLTRRRASFSEYKATVMEVLSSTGALREYSTRSLL